jgi:hypothetical protein
MWNYISIFISMPCIFQHLWEEKSRQGEEWDNGKNYKVIKLALHLEIKTRKSLSDWLKIAVFLT